MSGRDSRARRPAGRVPPATFRRWLAGALPQGLRGLVRAASTRLSAPFVRARARRGARLTRAAAHEPALLPPAAGKHGAGDLLPHPEALAPVAMRPRTGGLPLMPAANPAHTRAFLKDGTATLGNLTAAGGWPPRFEPSGRGALWDAQLAQLDPLRGAGALPAEDWLDQRIFDLLTRLAAYHPAGDLRLWGDANVVATRLQTLTDLFARRPALARRAAADRAVTAWIAAHLPWLEVYADLLPGNQAIRAAAALIVGGTSLAPHGRWRTSGIQVLERVLNAQILADGVHFERAPAFHGVVLADLIQCDHVLRTAGFDTPELISRAIASLRAGAALLALPDDTLPTFGDAAPTLHRPSDLGVPRLTASTTHLRAAGFVVVRGPVTLAMDVGPFGADDLSGHGHADLFALAIYRGIVPVVVDPGTFTLEAGEARQYFRGTPAHGTLNVDGADSTEVWDRFHAGRRAQPRDVQVTVKSGVTTISGAHDAFANAGHERRITVDGATVTGVDRATGSGTRTVEIVFPLAPGVVAIRSVDGRSVDLPNLGLFTVVEGPDVAIELGRVALDFHREEASPVLVLRVTAPLPVSVTWRFDLA